MVPAFQKYVAKLKKKHKGDSKKAHADARKILAKYKVAKVQELKSKDFAAVMEAIA